MRCDRQIFETIAQYRRLVLDVLAQISGPETAYVSRKRLAECLLSIAQDACSYLKPAHIPGWHVLATVGHCWKASCSPGGSKGLEDYAAQRIARHQQRVLIRVTVPDVATNSTVTVEIDRIGALSARTLAPAVRIDRLL